MTKAALICLSVHSQRPWWYSSYRGTFPYQSHIHVWAWRKVALEFFETDRVSELIKSLGKRQETDLVEPGWPRINDLPDVMVFSSPRCGEERGLEYSGNND